MKFLLGVVIVLMGGCSSAPPVPPQMASGPSAQDQEVALEIVWEGVLGMKVEQRPQITWWVSCPDGSPNTGCYDEYSTPGNVNLIWVGQIPETTEIVPGDKISNTHFSVWLEGQWEFIAYPGTLAPGAVADAKTREEQAALHNAGL